VVHSSWSNSPTIPRFRALIPTDEIVDVEGYKLITRYMISRLNEEGFYSADEIERKPEIAKGRKFRGIHGCDLGKLGPASIFFLPSRGANPSAAFFIDFNAPPRCTLRVCNWLENAPVRDAPVRRGALQEPDFKPLSSAISDRMAKLKTRLHQVKRNRFGENKKMQIEIALSEWSRNDRPRCRDRGLCELGVKLRRAGCTESEALDHLMDAASASVAKATLRPKAQRLAKTLYPQYAAGIASAFPNTASGSRNHFWS